METKIRKKRECEIVFAFGEKKTLAEWFKDSRCFINSVQSYDWRIKAGGMTPTEAIETPRKIKLKAEVPVGTRHGKLISTAEYRRHCEKTEVLCQCDCGETRWVKVHEFDHGRVKSCGTKCLLKFAERMAKEPDRKKRNRQNTKDWSKKNCERRREYKRQWDAKNPDRVSSYDHYRRKSALTQSNPDREAIREIYKLAKSRVACICYLCGKITLTSSERQVDHRTPICRDGDHSRDNLAIACSDCNLRKHAKTDLEFLRENHERVDELTLMFFWIMSHLSL